MITATTDYDGLLQANLMQVFGERDESRRRAAIDRLYTADAVLYEPERIAAGRSGISDAVTALLKTLPPDFAFTSEGPAVGHHGLGRLRWRAGAPGASPVVTGIDVARVGEGRITSLHVFLDPPASGDGKGAN